VVKLHPSQWLKLSAPSLASSLPLLDDLDWLEVGAENFIRRTVKGMLDRVTQMEGVALTTEDIYGISRKDNFKMILEDWLFSSPFPREANEILAQIYTEMYKPKRETLARDLQALNKELIEMMAAPVLPFAAIPDL